MMSFIGVGIGFILIGLVLFDVFQTLFNPQQHGSSSHQIVNWIWRRTSFARSTNSRAQTLAGPILLTMIILGWILTITFGWALIYHQFLPGDEFRLASGMDPVDQSGLVDAMYLSAAFLVTVGLGEITPQSDFLRVMVPLQAGIGFILLTAGITWVLSVQPAIARRRQLAHLLNLIDETARPGRLVRSDTAREETRALVREVVDGLVRTRIDLLQYPITYYFRTSDERTDFFRALPTVSNIVDAAEQDDDSIIWLDALQQGLDDLLEVISGQFHDEVLDDSDERD